MVRNAGAILLAAGLITGCATQPPPKVPIPEIVEVCALPEEVPEYEPWVFTPVQVLGLQAVKDMGGTNADLYYVAVRDADAARSANTKLQMAQEFADKLIQIIREAQHGSD